MGCPPRHHGAVSRATILHVDLDAFFAAVEQRDRPELRGRPIAVGGGGASDRGVVSAASYEARRYGVHSAMPLRTAARLCPELVFVPVDGHKYGRVNSVRRAGCSWAWQRLLTRLHTHTHTHTHTNKWKCLR